MKLFIQSQTSTVATVEVWVWISKFIPHLAGHVLIIQAGLNPSHVSKMGSGVETGICRDNLVSTMAPDALCLALSSAAIVLIDWCRLWMRKGFKSLIPPQCCKMTEMHIYIYIYVCVCAFWNKYPCVSVCWIITNGLDDSMTTMTSC